MPANGAQGGSAADAAVGGHRPVRAAAPGRAGAGPVDREAEAARLAARRGGRATARGRRPVGRAAGYSSEAFVSPIPIARPSPGGAASVGLARRPGRCVAVGAGVDAVPPPGGGSGRRWRRVRRATRSAAKSRRGREPHLDGRDLLVLGHAERGAAAAGGDDVRVVHLEPGALQRVDVVDVRAVDVREALVVDEDAQALVLEDRVAVALVVEGELVLEARNSRRRARRPAGRRWTRRRPGTSRNSRTFSAPFSVNVTPLAWYVTCVVLIASRSIASRYPVLDRCPRRRDQAPHRGRDPRRHGRGRGLDRRRRPLPRDRRVPRLRRA